MKENNPAPTNKPAINSPSGCAHGSPIRATAAIGGLLATVGLLVYTALADPAPVLTIAPLGGNAFSITVTNAANPTNYILYWTPALGNPNYPWEIVATNATGETNFAMDMGAWPSGFFKVLLGDGDEDGDGIPAWMDAQSQNSAVGALAVTIDSPVNGSILY